MTVLPRTAAAVLPLVVVLALAGCSGDDSEEPAEGAPSSDSAGTDSISPPDLPEVPEVRKARGAVADLTLGDCPTGAGEQTVEGEIVNGGDQRRDVLVVLSWTNDTSDVLGRGVAVVEDLPPGETQTFTVTADVAEGATQCVPNVQRGVVGG